MTTATLPRVLGLFDALTPAEQRATVTSLFNGRPTFDVAATPSELLSHYVRTWTESGALSADRIGLECARVVAARFAAPAPVAPVPVAPAAAAVATVIDEWSAFPAGGTLGAPAAPAPVAAAPFAPGPLDAAAPAPVADKPAKGRRKPAAATQDDDAATAAPVTLGARPASPQRVPARSLFEDQPQAIIDAIPADLFVMYYADPAAPAVDAGYAYSADSLAAALMGAAQAVPERMWAFGPRGSGKSEFCQQIAARLGRAYFRVSFHRATEASDILGDIGLRDGATQWVDGPVTQAIRTPGAVLTLDEITYCPTAHLASLNPVLERRGAALRLPKTGEVLSCAADVIVFAADNTAGHGASAEYAGRVQVSSDTLDRFQKFLAFDYLPADTERAVLRAMVESYCGTKPSSAMARAVCKIMGTARAKADAGELEGAPSLRRAAAFCTALVQGMDAAKAYTLTVVNPAPQDSQEALRQIFAASWDHGTPAPAVDPSNPFAATTEGSI